eukprot:m.95405 g.95405  ORF g.95405 m.95405 type:complete len:439 (+) comp21921_c0_seq2:356-1672(+)
MLTSEFLTRLAPLAALFFEYGILSGIAPCFSAPMILGHLSTADPLNPDVIKWWQNATLDFYQTIPSAFGYLVKADSEGQPGPSKYNRTEVQGANLFAFALSNTTTRINNQTGLTSTGVVMWRAFSHPPTNPGLQPSYQYSRYSPFNDNPLDNVILQVKNGPEDFQVREPVHALFQLSKVNLMLEVEVTQEYTGQAKHVVNLASMWKSYLDFDLSDGEGKQLQKMISGKFTGQQYSGTAGVSNLGSFGNWTGHVFSQVNTYSYGRLSWDPTLSAETVTAEWLAATFFDSKVQTTLLPLLLDSWETYENYTSPLGLGFVCAGDHYHMDMPHREPTTNASKFGVGFHRPLFANDYNTSVFRSIESCPESLLLAFYNLPYDYQLIRGSKSGGSNRENNNNNNTNNTINITFKSEVHGPCTRIETNNNFPRVSVTPPSHPKRS